MLFGHRERHGHIVTHSLPPGQLRRRRRQFASALPTLANPHFTFEPFVEVLTKTSDSGKLFQCLSLVNPSIPSHARSPSSPRASASSNTPGSHGSANSIAAKAGPRPVAFPCPHGWPGTRASATSELPLIDRAFESGELSYSKVRALTRVAEPAQQQALIDVAKSATASQLDKIVGGLRRVRAAATPRKTSFARCHADTCDSRRPRMAWCAWSL